MQNIPHTHKKGLNKGERTQEYKDACTTWEWRTEGPRDWLLSFVTKLAVSGLILELLNNNIKRAGFPLPMRNEIFAERAEATFFSKLDASAGIWQNLLNAGLQICT